jgi:HNH endonuclease
MNVIERWWSYVEQTDTCWYWTGRIDEDGYGRFRFNLEGRQIEVRAYRFGYILLVGDIPDGHELDHLCKNRSCVRPDHLEPVIHRVNTLRSDNFIAVNAKKTHCPKGHAYDEANTYLYPNGSRQCRTCRREGIRRLYHERKETVVGR